MPGMPITFSVIKNVCLNEKLMMHEIAYAMPEAKPRVL